MMSPVVVDGKVDTYRLPAASRAGLDTVGNPVTKLLTTPAGEILSILPVVPAASLLAT